MFISYIFFIVIHVVLIFSVKLHTSYKINESTKCGLLTLIFYDLEITYMAVAREA